MTLTNPDIALEEIRREIDAIDDAMLDLMVRRLSATARVRSQKHTEGSLTASPFRPAREAQMLRRLVATGGKRIDPNLVVRLWRVILSSSIQHQAPVTLHVAHELSDVSAARVELAEHFCGFEVKGYGKMTEIFAALSANRGDLAVVRTESAWAESLAAGAQVIGTLPVLKQGSMPHLLVIGHAQPVPSGDDETILLSSEPLFAGNRLATRWQSRSGIWHVTCVPGFESEAKRQDSFGSEPSYRVAGRFPASIEVSQ